MKTTYKFILLLLALMPLAGCREGLLDQDPTDSLSKQQYWKNEDDAVSALAGVLSDTRYLFCRDYYLDGMGEYVKMRGNSFLSNNGNNGRAYMGRWDYLPWGFGGWFENMYKYCYGSVNRANYLIENVEAMIDATDDAELRTRLQTIVAECKLMRALVYFRLITWWGDVPYIDWNVKSNAEVESLSRTQRPRRGGGSASRKGCRAWPIQQTCRNRAPWKNQSFLGVVESFRLART